MAQDPNRLPLRIGLVGTGFLAKTRARCWARVRNAEISRVASRTPDAAADFAREYALPNPAGSVAELLADPEIDAVDVCVPNAAHREIAVAAAEAGKHIICTKPLAAFTGHSGDFTDVAEVAETNPFEMWSAAEAEARAMEGAAREHGVQLCYGENWIYAPPLRRAAELLADADGVLLEMRGGEAHCGSHSPYAKQWQHTGGGALLRLGAHPVGAMLHLKRQEGLRRSGAPVRPIAVRGDVADLTKAAGLDPAKTSVATGWVDVENWGSVSIEFEDGTRGVAFGSDNRLGGMRSELELFASNTTLQCNLSPVDQLRAYAPHDQVYPDADLIEKQSTTAGWSTPMTDEDWTSGQLGMCEAFAEDLLAGQAPESDAWLGIEVTRVIYAAYASAREGRRVALSEISA
ncbi:MAG: Gfo/Idh/MocA family protein [Myxococcota bacterium]